MADSFNKKEREKKRRKRKQDKIEKRKQKNTDRQKPEEFMYVDENGNLTSTPPDLTKRRTVSIEEIEISTPKKTDSDESPFLKEGRVKFFNTEKRYGFIEELGSRKDYFVHADNIIEKVKEGDKVVFEIGSGPKGPTAINVKLYKEKVKEIEKVQAEEAEKEEE